MVYCGQQAAGRGQKHPTYKGEFKFLVQDVHSTSGDRNGERRYGASERHGALVGRNGHLALILEIHLRLADDFA
jgi:hypothetical protein